MSKAGACCRNLERSAGEECSSRTCKPNSVRSIAAAGRSFLWAAHRCAALATYPKVVTHRAGTIPFLFGLAPCGVCPARRITTAAVRSYRTFSPLPRPFSPEPSKPHGSRQNGRGGIFSVALSVESGFPKKPGPLPDVIRHTALRSSDFPPRPFSSSSRHRVPHVSPPLRDMGFSLCADPSRFSKGEWNLTRMGGATARSGCLPNHYTGCQSPGWSISARLRFSEPRPASFRTNTRKVPPPCQARTKPCQSDSERFSSQA